MEQHPLKREQQQARRGAEATSAKNGTTSFEKGLLVISCNNIEK
jgi:hypothetical protein